MAIVRLAASIACALALAGCAFGQAEDSAEITDDQLAVMVLPRAELGTPVGFELDPADSGPISAREAADATTDPRDNAADLKRAGWLGGYELTFADPNRSVSFQRGEGVVMGDSTVQLFDTETSARAHLLGEIKDLERFRGQVVDGVRLARFETFEVDVGDEGWGVELTARARGVTLHGTGVLFRSGRLTADTGFLHLDRADRRGEAVAAARALESRIARVLAGDLAAKPVPLPVEETRAPLPKPTQLARMTLALEDLPPGARLADEGRWTSGRDSVSYYRTFDVEQTMLGSSHLEMIRAETRVFATERSAQRALRAAASPAGRRAFARTLVRNFARITGATAENVEVRPLARPGANAAGFVVTFDLPGGRFKTATIFVRSGRSLANVTGFCRAQAVNPDDLRPLAATARNRLAA
jgi:hypothetical protein